MPVLEIQEVVPGMITENPVRNQNGQILIGEGVILTDKHLRILKTWGVKNIQIEGSNSEHPPEDVDFKAIQEQIDFRFCLNLDKHPLIEKLKAVLMRQLLHEQREGC